MPTLLSVPARTAKPSAVEPASRLTFKEAPKVPPTGDRIFPLFSNFNLYVVDVGPCLNSNTLLKKQSPVSFT